MLGLALCILEVVFNFLNWKIKFLRICFGLYLGIVYILIRIDGLRSLS